MKNKVQIKMKPNPSVAATIRQWALDVRKQSPMLPTVAEFHQFQDVCRALRSHIQNYGGRVCNSPKVTLMFTYHVGELKGYVSMDHNKTGGDGRLGSSRELQSSDRKSRAVCRPKSHKKV